MKLIGATRSPTREELPRSIVPIKKRSIAQVRPEYLERMMSKPERLQPVPEGKPAGIAKRMQNLAQYGGRSEKGRRNALSNIKARVKSTMSDLPNKAPEIPAGVPVPVVPTAVPAIPHHDLMRGKALRAALSQEEYDLYVETWIEWFKCHGENFDKVEDHMDVHHICMEAVIQFRTTLLMQQYPTRDYSQPYNQSFNRQQKARENLEARRSDRLNRQSGSGGSGYGGFGAKGGPTNVFNGPVSIVAGQVTLADREQRAQEAQRKALDFLANTASTVLPGEEDDDVVDGEIVEKTDG